MSSREWMEAGWTFAESMGVIGTDWQRVPGGWCVTFQHGAGHQHLTDDQATWWLRGWQDGCRVLLLPPPVAEELQTLNHEVDRMRAETQGPSGPPTTRRVVWQAEKLLEVVQEHLTRQLGGS